MALLEAAYGSSADTLYSLENPADRKRAPFASVFATAEVARLKGECEGKSVELDQCAYDLKYRKPTQIVANAPALASLARVCPHDNQHADLSGKDETGKFRT